jgi:virginiamycin B lyase
VRAGATEIDITGDWLSAGAGAVWLSDPQSSTIYRLDTESGETVATVAIPQGPCAASDFGLGALWTETCDKAGLAKIDPSTNRVSAHVALPVGAVGEDGEASVGAGEGAVWLVVGDKRCESCSVVRVDPRALRVVARIPVREGAAAVRVGEGGVWVTNPSKSIVQKIDPRTNRVVLTTQVGPTPRFLAVGEGGVWTLNQGDGSLTRLDPTSGEVLATIPAQVIGEGGDITTGDGSVWVRGSDFLLTSVDPGSNAIDTRYGPSSGSGAVIVASGAVWVSAHAVSKVWRLPSSPH